MEKMPGHTRLYRRVATYYHRAGIPVDIKDTYPKTEETFSLRTKDYHEALKRVRVTAVKVDQRFEAHRQRLAQQASTPLAEELNDLQIRELGQQYYASILSEDDDTRLDGFGPESPPTAFVMADAPHEAIQQLVSDRLEQLPNFEERVDKLEQAVENDRYNYARGIIDQHHIDEAEDILRWAGINLNPRSQSLQKLARELQAANIRASEAISQRNQGEPIATPDIDAPAPIGGTAPLLSKVAEDWIAEKSRTSWVEKTTRENTVWINNFILVAGDKQLNQYSKADGRAFKSLLMKLPPNWNKQKALKGMDIVSAADKAAQVELKPMAHRTANKIMQFVGAFWNWAACNPPLK